MIGKWSEFGRLSEQEGSFLAVYFDSFVLRCIGQLVGGTVVATPIVDGTLPAGVGVGVRASRDPAGALGAWTCTAKAAICVPDGTRRIDLVPALKINGIVSFRTSYHTRAQRI